MDFDGDGIDDLTVYHAELGDWYTFSSLQNALVKTRLGGPELQPVIGDFDGDGKTDLAHYRASDGRWTIRRSSNNSTQILNLGSLDDAPVPADYDGDGITDIAVYNRKSGTWRIRESSTGNIRIENFGWFEAKPVPADYDGDGKADLAVFHRDSGNWYIFGSDSGFRIVNFGFRDVRPVPADYDGDGKADLAVYERKTGTWYIFGSSTGFRTLNWGWSRARAIPGDYDGDGIADIAVYQREIGRWYIWQSSTQSSRFVTWGWNQSTPLASYRNGGIEGHVILSFGDSITYGTSSACDCPLTGYPALLKRLLGPALGGYFDTINAGVPGETTSDGRARLPAWLAREKPELLILMEGTNDHFFNTNPNTIENNLRAMIQQAQAAGCDVVLATIPPVITNQFRDRSAQAQRIQQFNPRIYSIANSLGIPVAPIFEAITAVPNWQNTLIDQPTANHPNDAGYRIVAQTFLNTIRTAIQNGQFY
ncbi:MAG TPA: GDSL-type esterase/lipase family protein [Kiritimatiellia bacterium]|nr:GDSL-type esterase/lipase family protein [Kiritimatiellia bacterium]